mmetsp:Transcript_34880/g.108486  ORF Transcript_34880/g.108486 Transcript_34880/m.108486 type:complete len:214 (+) Transcript_34880:1299-1940(+)
MQITPRSARTIAPASRVNSLEPASRIMAAVRPTPLEPLPVVLTASGEMFMTKRSICDFPQDGSPTNSTLMSPRRCVPLARFFSVPPTICNSSPSLTFAWPQMDGANERARSWKESGRAAISLMFRTSSLTKGASIISFTGVMLVATRRAGQTPFVKSWGGGGKERYTPMTWTRSPGLALSARSPSQITSTLRGIWPGGEFSGASWMLNFWKSL